MRCIMGAGPRPANRAATPEPHALSGAGTAAVGAGAAARRGRGGRPPDPGQPGRRGGWAAPLGRGRLQAGRRGRGGGAGLQATPGLRAGAPALISPSSPPPARFPPPRTVPAAPALSLRPCPSRRPGRSSPARVPCCGRPDSEPRFLSRECASVFCVLLLCHEKEPLQNSAVRFFYQRSCRRRFV